MNDIMFNPLPPPNNHLNLVVVSFYVGLYESLRQSFARSKLPEPDDLMLVARDYSADGCYEPMFTGRSEFKFSYISLPKVRLCMIDYRWLYMAYKYIALGYLWVKIRSRSPEMYALKTPLHSLPPVASTPHPGWKWSTRVTFILNAFTVPVCFHLYITTPASI